MTERVRPSRSKGTETASGPAPHENPVSPSKDADLRETVDPTFTRAGSVHRYAGVASSFAASVEVSNAEDQEGESELADMMHAMQCNGDPNCRVCAERRN